MTWIERSEEAALTASIESDAELVTVHGLGGSGSSAIVARALEGVPSVRVDLEGLTRAREVRERLRDASARARRRAIVWIDQAHHTALARDAIASLREPGVRWVIAARASLGLAGEQSIVLGPLDRERTRALLELALRRVAVSVDGAELEMLAEAVDGWPLAANVAALETRVFGSQAVARRGVIALESGERRCTSVLDDGWRALDREARDALAVLSFSRAPLEAEEVAARADAVSMLVDRGLATAADGLVRTIAPIASYVRTVAGAARSARARRRHAELVLAHGERARDAYRRDPIAMRAVLERLRGDLLALACDDAPSVSVRAALALEPLLVGRLGRLEVLALFERARRDAEHLDAHARADVALALARTWITRGDHETAEALLRATLELDARPETAGYRDIYLAHIAAWRGDVDEATALLGDGAAGGATHVEEDRLLQRTFVAFRRGDLDETSRLARACAERAATGPSPRLRSLARRFAAEVMLQRGHSEEAAALLERTRDELDAFGDHAGALFTSSRIVDALRAAGEHERAEAEARRTNAIAARSGEVTMELAVLGALDDERVPWARVAELAWRVQIPMLREQAERWLAARAPSAPPLVLRLDPTTHTASLAERTVSLARRASLWRALQALVDAHARSLAASTDALFAAGWPGERATASSRRKRVQTAVWTLRRMILGDALRTLPEGYALAPEVRTAQSG